MRGQGLLQCSDKLAWWGFPLFLCARLAWCPEPRQLNGPAQFLWRRDHTIECFQLILCFFSSKIWSLDSCNPWTFWPSSPWHLCFFTVGLFQCFLVSVYYHCKKNCALNSVEDNLNYKFSCFPTEPTPKIQSVWSAENGRLPGRWLKGDTNQLNPSQFWWLNLRRGFFYSVCSNIEFWVMLVYNFMVTKFDFILSKSHHSFPYFLIFLCYELMNTL